MWKGCVENSMWSEGKREGWKRSTKIRSDILSDLTPSGPLVTGVPEPRFNRKFQVLIASGSKRLFWSGTWDCIVVHCS